MLYLNEDESFSLTANVTSTGYQGVVLSGYLVDHRSDGTYIAPLIPELFYGANGSQLGASWRQNLTTTGSQVILSRSGGYPKVPREELFWRKVSDFEAEKKEVAKMEETPTPTQAITVPTIFLLLLGLIGAGAVFYYVISRK